MNNQYVGDIGDYTKLGLLRAILNTGLSLGVNWYKTPDNGCFEYLNKPCDTPDTELFSALKSIVSSQTRTMETLESSGLLKGAAFYGETLDLSAFGNREHRRKQWHKNALTALQLQDVVFLDPDTGFIPKKTKPYTAEGKSYVTYEEAADYYNANKSSVIVYQHFNRKEKSEYIPNILECFKKLVPIDPNTVLCVKNKEKRDFIVFSQPKHFGRIERALKDLIVSGWNNHLELRDFIPTV